MRISFYLARHFYDETMILSVAFEKVFRIYYNLFELEDLNYHSHCGTISSSSNMPDMLSHRIFPAPPLIGVVPEWIISPR